MNLKLTDQEAGFLKLYIREDVLLKDKTPSLSSFARRMLKSIFKKLGGVA